MFFIALQNVARHSYWYELKTWYTTNFDADIDVDRYKKKSYDELSDCYNENLYIPSVPTLSQKSAIRHFCTQGAADWTYNCT